MPAAALRLHVGKSDGRTIINVLKRRGGGTPPPIQLDLHGLLTKRPAAVPAAFLRFQTAH